MRFLILKDFMIQRRTAVITTLILIVLIISWSSSDWPISIIFTLGSFLVTLSLVYGGIGHDEQNDSMKFILTLPLSRKNIVIAKYTSSLFAVVIGALITFVVIQLLGFILGSLQSPNWTTICGSILGSFVPIALILSIYYIFGYSNLKYIYAGLIFLAIIFGVLYTQTVVISALVEWSSKLSRSLLLVASVIISAVIFTGSLALSTWALTRKEF